MWLGVAKSADDFPRMLVSGYSGHLPVAPSLKRLIHMDCKIDIISIKPCNQDDEALWILPLQDGLPILLRIDGTG